MAGSSGGGGDDLLSKKKDFLEQFFKKGAEFSEELLKENEKLRYRVVQLEESLNTASRSNPSDDTLRELVGKIHDLESEREQLMKRFEKTETGSAQYLSRYEEIEEENNNLASLYVATSQLHSTYDPGEALVVIAEILLNFVGVKAFATLLLDDQSKLRAVDAVGLDVADVPVYTVGEGTVGRVAKLGEEFFGTLDAGAARPPADPLICIALRKQDEVVGALAIWELFEQKTSLVDVDYEIFSLLATNAATALNAARLTAAAEAGTPPAFDFASIMELL